MQKICIIVFAGFASRSTVQARRAPMKKWYSIGLLLLVVVMAASLLVACGSKEEAVTTTVAAATDTTVGAPASTAKQLGVGPAAADAALGLYGEDQGNNVLKVTDVPAPGLAFPISTSGDFAMTIEALGADGAVLGTITTDTGLVDYSQYAATAAKLRITTIDGTVYEYAIPGK
jgi:hypothetical protein